MKLALYPGTFDPLTLGHEDVIERALMLFDRLILAIAANPGKQPLFSLEQRVALAQARFADQTRIEVLGFSGLLVDFMHIHQAQWIVRGIRSGADVDYELPLAQLNAHLAQVETVFLPPRPNKSFIAASYVREIASLGGDVSGLVSPDIARAIHLGFIKKEE